ncbi:MAG: hypothetical protein C0399_12150 [Syntrophus sp. (in: bacteria)]|nr:hypothetical protein [Syntrophus sp. (in: bacteria)]
MKNSFNTKLHSKAHRGGDREPTLPVGGQANSRAKRVEGVAGAPTTVGLGLIPVEGATHLHYSCGGQANSRAKRVEGVAPTAYAGGGGDPPSLPLRRTGVSPINREAPPETCPICKAKKERFEQFI